MRIEARDESAFVQGDARANIFTAPTDSDWQIDGLGGNDVLSGAKKPTTSMAATATTS